jgi:hypothetical protein
MKHRSMLLAGVTLFALSTGQVFAGCADEIASLSPNPQVTGAIGGEGAGSTGKVSKDGSLAPLGSAAEATRPSGGPGIAKDGSTMPLATQPGGGNTNIATSRQDAQAQQRSGEGADSTGKISKDGSLAPLGSAAEASRPSGGPGIAKDGSTIPLANRPGGGDTDVAMSRQDAQAQQRSGETAAAAGGGAMGTGPATSESRPQPRVAALERARTLLRQGDERGCMEAVQEAKRLQ